MEDIDHHINQLALKLEGCLQEKLSSVQEAINKTGPMTSLDFSSLIEGILVIRLTSIRSKIESLLTSVGLYL